MKESELRSLATKIAEAERTIQTSKSEEEIQKAKLKIIQLTQEVTSFSDFLFLESEIQNLLDFKNFF